MALISWQGSAPFPGDVLLQIAATPCKSQATLAHPKGSVSSILKWKTRRTPNQLQALLEAQSHLIELDCSAVSVAANELL